MANTKTSDLVALLASQVDGANDLFYVADLSEVMPSDRSKKMTFDEITAWVNGATIYEELDLDAGAWRPSDTDGATKESTDLDGDHYLFQSLTEQSIQLKWTPPNSWDRLPLKFKIYSDVGTGATPVTDGFTWGISAVGYNNADTLGASYPTSVDVDETVIAAGDLHTSPATANVTPSGTLQADTTLLIQISRKVADPNDTMSEDAKFLKASVQFGRIINNSTQW